MSTPNYATNPRILADRIASLLVLRLTLPAGKVLVPSLQPSKQFAAQSVGQRDLSQGSRKELMNIEVTSVCKKEQKMSQVATIFVSTQEDPRRSGATHIPDLLRMVSGLDVSQCNANSWPVSARGYNT